MICQPRQRFLVGLKTIPEEEAVHFHVNDGPYPTDDAINGDRDFINQSRVQHNLKPLHRSAVLDTIALVHAQSMAQGQAVVHSVKSILELQQKLRSRHVGENVQRGASIKQIHHDSMAAQEGGSFIRRNILSTSFDEMGMATAMGRDGILYLCQVFRSSRE
jgi:uncharacterized protein YkwD